MSETVTNVEVEDVLNSIRRLVSEEVDDRRLSATVEADRFVLTPALRVLDTENEPDETHLPDSVVPVLALGAEYLVADAAADEPEHSSSLDHEIFDAHPLHHGENPETEAEAIPQAWDQAAEFFDGSRDAAPSDNVELESSDIAGEIEFAIPDAHQPEADDMPLEDRIAELELAVSQVEGEWEPDGSEPEAEQKPVRHIFATTRVEPSDAGLADDPDQSDAIATDTVEKEAKTDPSAKATFAHAPFRLHGATNLDAVEKEPKATDASLSDAIDIDEQILDEDGLREMVADIVREELQGAMGERITRNVRRMVRREIQRAIALKDFE